MTTQCPVVVAYDFSHTGHAALHRAVNLAAGAPQHVLHVVCVADPREPIPSIPSYQGVDDAYLSRVQEALASAVGAELELARPAHPVTFYVHARRGRPAEEILALAAELCADVIVIGSHGLTGLERIVLGSVSEHVVREAGCTVEVARTKRYTRGTAGAEVYDRAHRYEYTDRRALLRPADWPVA